ncbi:uncharacterized protein LOC106181593 isoform X2 [Lingula anatina]|uniref:Uncharacterized protein LOC106181593 isoform X2 n=1 Tax=Lingula anatina TaxID=7574 RepID=A0A1S3KFS8_LINAN|nr:uncharacterized protein LOC106181593 isoform X2 [Lingula anatina]|eukprot:XP_013421493.1 uncharacterized protein LOC106181593 isoform X2 [Lingula anatina]
MGETEMQTMKVFVVFVAVFAIEQASAAVNTNTLARTLHNKLSSLLKPQLVLPPVPPGRSYQFVTPKLDFLFVLDSSGSITARYFEEAKDVCKIIVDYIHGSATATGPALQLAKTEMNAKSRPGNVRVVWVITDGKSNSGVKPKIPADDLRANGVTVCVVGVGNSVNDVELNQIGDSGCVFRSDSYSQLKTAARMAYNLSRPRLSSGFFNNLSFKRV